MFTYCVFQKSIQSMFYLGNVRQFNTSEKLTYLPHNSLVPPSLHPSEKWVTPPPLLSSPTWPGVLPWPSPLLPSPAMIPMEQLGNLPPWGWQFTVKTHATRLPTRRPWYRHCRAHGPWADCPALGNGLRVLLVGRKNWGCVGGWGAVFVFHVHYCASQYLLLEGIPM